jgi:hypothetical protein
VKHDVALVRPAALPSYVLAACTTTPVAGPLDARRIVARLSQISWEQWSAWHG